MSERSELSFANGAFAYAQPSFEYVHVHVVFACDRLIETRAWLERLDELVEVRDLVEKCRDSAE